MTGETGFCLGARRAHRRATGIHDHVDHRQRVLMLPEILADASLDAIARDRASGDTHADREPEPRVRKTVRFRADEEQRVGRTLTGLLDGIELRLRQQPKAAREAARRIVTRYYRWYGQVRPRGACGPSHGAG